MWRILRYALGGLSPAVAILAGGVILAPAGHVDADVTISDFEPGSYQPWEGFDGWFNYSGMPYMAIDAAPTGGTTNWLAVGPYQYYSNFTAQNWAVGVPASAFIDNDNLEMDIIVPGSGPNAWYPSNPAQAIQVELQLTGGLSGTVNHYLNGTFNTSLKDQVLHVALNLNSLPLDPTATGWNLTIQQVQPGYAWEWDSGNPNVVPYAPRVYFDNIQLTQVPEPASLGLLSIGGLVAVRRRRA